MKKSTENWLELSRRDLIAAENLLKVDQLENLVVFHSQQAVEKVLKSALCECGKEIPKTHSLLRLYKILTDNSQFACELDLSDLNMLEDIYIDSRYPGDEGILPSGFPLRDDAEVILSKARNIWNIVSGRLQVIDCGL